MTDWTARIEWAVDHEPNESELDVWLNQLEAYHVSIGMLPAKGDEPRYMAATISLEASTLRQATQEALRLVEGATGGRAIVVEVLPTEEFDRRLEQPVIPELVGYAEIAEVLGVSRQRAREIANTVKPFPAAAVHVSSGPLYIRDSVEAWAKTWERKPGRPRSMDSASTESGGGK